MNKPYDLETIASKEYMPGFHGKMIHSDQVTLAYWKIEANAVLPLHNHPHEQIVNMLSGEFELVLDGIPHHCKAGQVLIIPSNTPHSGKAITACRILDVFQPVREDYKE